MSLHETYEMHLHIADVSDETLYIDNGKRLPKRHVVALNKPLEKVEAGDTIHAFLIGWVASKHGLVKEVA